MFELDDRVALVTGSAHGIGRATTLALARQGASVVGADLRPQEGLEEHLEEVGAGGEALQVDVSDREQVEQAVQGVLDRYQRIDILVNNAGIFPTKRLEEMEYEDWDEMMRINLNGTFNMSRNVLPAMKDQSFGRIVNISSLAGGVIGWSGKLSHYAASKGGVLGFTRSAALDLAEYDITVNAIAPGMIDTGAPQAANTEEELEFAINLCPANRMGDPEELAAAVVFLCSDEAAYVTGECLTVDGGFSKI